VRRGRPKSPVAVKRLSRDLLARIRRAEWAQGRKLREVRNLSRTPRRESTVPTWGRILKAMQ
jgi:hypothetical protein